MAGHTGSMMNWSLVYVNRLLSDLPSVAGSREYLISDPPTRACYESGYPRSQRALSTLSCSVENLFMRPMIPPVPPLPVGGGGTCEARYYPYKNPCIFYKQIKRHSRNRSAPGPERSPWNVRYFSMISPEHIILLHEPGLVFLCSVKTILCFHITVVFLLRLPAGSYRYGLSLQYRPDT